MKNFSITTLFLLIINLIYSQPNDANIFFTTSYTALTIPQLYHGDLFFLDPTSGTTKKEKTDDLKHDKNLLPSLSLITSAVTIYQSDESGNLTLMGQSISASNSDYVVIYDFSQTQQLSFILDDNMISGLIGVAVRMTAKLHTKKKGINLSNLFGVGIAASQNKLIGSLEVKSYGIESKTVNEIIPVPTDLSTGTIQNALSAVATIKSHIYDPETYITPLWLAYNITSIGVSKGLPKAEYKNLLNLFK